MGITPMNDNDAGTLGRVTEPDDSPGKNPNNSADRADKGYVYEPVDHPTGIKDLGNSINMWAYYLKHFTDGAFVDIKALEDRVAKLEGKAAMTEPATHLDPPPDPPYAPAPT
jgi:hypothetical protein